MKSSHPLIVVYDGHCAICRAAKDKLLHMFGDRIETVDFRTVPPEQIHPDLTPVLCQAQLHVLDGDRVYGAAEAMVRLLRMHSFYRYVVPLYYVPPFGWIAERVYKWISKNRFRLSKLLGKKQSECTDACTIHWDEKKPRKR
ncbi:MAG: thiol-disulfide oxidoreductase DCC family protein [Tumebacillaceae bacterium]